MNGEGGGGVGFEQVVDEGEDGHDRRGRGEETQARQALDEARDGRGRQMVGGRQEGIQKAQDTGAVFAVQQVPVEERVQARVEGGIVEVAGHDEVEQALQGRNREAQISRVEAVGEEIHQDLRAAEARDRVGRLELLEEGFALMEGHGGSDEGRVRVHGGG